MCLILTKAGKLSLTDVSNFYFRRFNRIIPVYLTVLFFTILGCKYFVAPMEYEDIVNDLFYSATFVSNWHFIKVADYYDMVWYTYDIKLYNFWEFLFNFFLVEQICHFHPHMVVKCGITVLSYRSPNIYYYLLSIQMETLF